MQKINKVISAKLCKLLAFLHHATEEFESVSKKIKDKNIKMSVREVALETNQYKSELDSHLTSLRIKRMDDTDVINGEKRNLINNNSTIDIATDKEIMTECCKTEIYFEKAYRNVLN